MSDGSSRVLRRMVERGVERGAVLLREESASSSLEHCLAHKLRRHRLMREDALLLGPEPGHDKVLMLAGREVNEAIDSPPHSYDPSARW